MVLTAWLVIAASVLLMPFVVELPPPVELTPLEASALPIIAPRSEVNCALSMGNESEELDGAGLAGVKLESPPNSIGNAFPSNEPANCQHTGTCEQSD